MIEHYGLSLGRLWARWPHFNLRDFWIGAFIKEPYWEGGIKRQTIFVCPVPFLVFEFTIALDALEGTNNKETK